MFLLLILFLFLFVIVNARKENKSEVNRTESTENKQDIREKKRREQVHIELTRQTVTQQERIRIIV